MLLYCFKRRKITESKNQKVVMKKNGKIILLSKCSVCDSKKLKSIKEEEAIELLSSLGIKIPSSKTTLVGPRLF